MREREFIGALRTRFPGAGLGDDTAVVPPPEGEMLLASDAVVEGVHFSLSYSSPGQAVQKAVTSNISDIYAMGGRPERVLFSAGIPPGAGGSAVNGIVDGLEAACGHYSLELAGGDTVSSPGGFFFDVAITGVVEAGTAIRRSGASPGDLLCISGPCGASLGGLWVLEAATGKKGSCPFAFDSPESASLLGEVEAIARTLDISTSKKDLEEACGARGLAPGCAEVLDMARHHLVPRTRPLDIGLDRGQVTSMIDLSDGIASDLFSLCEAGGTGALIDADRIPAHGGLEALRGLGVRIGGEDLLKLLLSSGEEYLQLFTLRAGFAAQPGGGFRVIGEVTGEAGVLSLRGPGGETRPLPGRGWEHGI